MTSPSSPDVVAPRGRADRSQTFIDWIQLNSRWLVIGAIVVVAAGAIWWFMAQKRANETRSANAALLRAKQSLNANNAALAQTDLQSVVSRYADTGPGAEAAMLLATLYYDQGKYAEGIQILQKEIDQGSAEPFRPRMFSLMGDGYGQQKKLAEAAAEYEKAANAADPTDRKLEHAYQLSKAARTFEAAGKTDEAKRLWTELASSDVESVAAEAKVRLAELNAELAARS